ncbi:MAG: hypothetical protein E6Q97_38545 [Desulfurellales bacterium]|nr:MAG: hypothetical protein E6Q97_38545 [Desulfurellales bacterium]
MSDYEKDIVHLTRLALDGKAADVAAISRRLLRAVAAWPRAAKKTPSVLPRNHGGTDRNMQKYRLNLYFVLTG